MTKFNSYFLMSKKEISEYVRQSTELFSDGANLHVEEIGNGNMNYVFRIVDLRNTKSIIVKQAGEHTRISQDIAVSTDRNTIEAEMLLLQGTFASEYVPKLYNYDIVMHCIMMEDLSGYIIMRDALLNYKKFPKFADDISTFLVHTLLPTTDIVLNHIEKKKMVKKFSNPQLCDITENFVFTEPYNALSKTNRVYEPNMEFVTEEVFNDEKLHLEVAKLKFEFMNNPQALIHGDLHTGSVFVKDNSIMIFDPEFAFFGPIGFDLGTLVANLIFAWIHAEALLEGVKCLDYLNWLERSIIETIDLFTEKFKKEFNRSVTESTAKVSGFLEYYIRRVLKDTVSYTGIEMIRRIVGMAHVKDITSIYVLEKRLRAERIIIKLAKFYIFNSNNIRNGKDYISLLKKITQNYN